MSTFRNQNSDLIQYESTEIDSFDPDVHAELVADTHFEQRLLKGGRFQASLERLTLPDCRLDRGMYSLPAFGRAAMPEDWVGIGVTQCLAGSAWVNGYHLGNDDLQVYTGGASIDCRCVPGSPWVMFQVPLARLQKAALAVNGRELSLPQRGFQYHRLPKKDSAICRQGILETLSAANQMMSTGDHSSLQARRLREQLTSGFVRTLDLTTHKKDLRSEHAAARKAKSVAILEELLRERLAAGFLMSEFAAAVGMSERSLEYLVKDVYGISLRSLFRIAQLHEIRNELIHSDPNATSIREIARRWRMMHGGRFAAAYRRFFGHLPSDTFK